MTFRIGDMVKLLRNSYNSDHRDLKKGDMGKISDIRYPIISIKNEMGCTVIDVKGIEICNSLRRRLE